MCETGKSSRASFRRDPVKRTKARLKLVHSDVCGPMSTESLKGSKFFLLFIDDYSKRTWCYFLKHKSKVFESFVGFKTLVEKEIGSPIKVLRIDNGGAYTSDQFGCFLKKHDIVHQRTAPYTLQHNGVCERKNRDVMC